jgi:uncharacterized membrane protein
MPYEWLPRQDDPKGEIRRLHLWPHRPLTQRGFAGFIGVTVMLIALPLFAALGSPVLWALLPFLAGAIWALWFALRKNARDREILEELTLSPTRIALTRHDRQGRRDWEGNPHWVRVHLHPTGGPVPNYLTLRGGPREVELGAFLAEEERLALQDELTAALAALR